MRGPVGDPGRWPASVCSVRRPFPLRPSSIARPSKSAMRPARSPPSALALVRGGGGGHWRWAAVGGQKNMALWRRGGLGAGFF